ncbi:uncharacterized protein [Phaseolus vulgaris]|uniref:uncharacterized protein n=1 Tax=Phaseolus vulgaris TaxID=3885 RepID=UPI0035CB5FF6
MEANLMECILRVPVKRNVNDIQVWGNGELKKYTVNSAYECLAKQTRGTHHVVFEVLWKAKAFPNVVITTWRVLIDRIPTRVRLSRREVLMLLTVCGLCQINEESCQHLFIECKYAQLVWSLCLNWLGIVFVQHNDPKSHFVSFHCVQASFKQNLMLKGIWTTVVRTISEQRNSIMFKKRVVDANEIFQMTQLKSWSWLKHRSNSFTYSLQIGLLTRLYV